MQDDRQRALLTGAGAHARHTARKSSARSRSASSRRAQHEVARADRGGEAPVEALGEAERGVHAVPPAAQRQLVGAQLAGVEEPVELDAREALPAQLLELGPAVLVHVPRVVRAARPLRRERAHVGGGDVDAALGPHQRAEVGEHRRRGPGGARSSAGTRPRRRARRSFRRARARTSRSRPGSAGGRARGPAGWRRRRSPRPRLRASTSTP